MRIDKNSPFNISRFRIDNSNFNSTMDCLANNYSTPKKVTEFERKVGKSVCRAAELAMSEFKKDIYSPNY